MHASGLIKYIRWAWTYWFAFVFAFWFLVFYPLFAFLLANPKRYRAANKLRVLWANLSFWCTGLWVEPSYEVPLDKSKTYVICANHSSYLDIIMLALVIPLDFNFMAKAELGKIPLFGIFFRTVDIAVNRNNNIAAHKAFVRASRQLKEDGRSIVIFPEGTVSKTAPVMSKFKAGAFKMALENEVPILPVTFPDNWKRLPDKPGRPGTPGRVRAFIHQPIPTQGLDSTAEETLKQKVFTIIETQLQRYESGQ